MGTLAGNVLRVTVDVKLPFHQHTSETCRKANLLSYLEFLLIFIPLWLNLN